jgi:hypothetical protein
LKQNNDFPEFLADAAQKTRQCADELCRDESNEHSSCRLYHRAWTTLRLIGLISGARTDHHFFNEQFSSFAKLEPQARVLIAGTADHAMLYMLYRAFRECLAEPLVTIVDRCATTLAVNSWYAEKIDASVKTHQTDLQNMEWISQSYDLVTTHSIFSFFKPEEFTSVLSALGQKLKIGGKLIFAQGISPDSPTGSRIRFSKSEANRFKKRAIECFYSCGETDGLDEALVQALAHGFAINKNICAIASSKDLLVPLANVGFRLDEVQEYERLPSNYLSSAPSQHERSLSLRVVATKIH